MERTSSLTHQIIKMANQIPDCTMNELRATLPYYTRNQVFLEVDRMNRTGQLRVSYKGSWSYRICPAEGGSRQAVDRS